MLFMFYVVSCPAPLWLWAPVMAGALSLPSVSLKEDGSLPFSASRQSLERDGKWWVQVGTTIYHEPPQTLGLSEKVSDYYYSRGPASALTEKLRAMRVGGTEHLHLFHAPQGFVELEDSVAQGSKRSSLSRLERVRHQQVLTDRFPDYVISSSYKNPLSVCGVEVEKHAVSQIREDGLMEGLNLFVGEASSRSWNDTTAQRKVINFLHAQFKSMDLPVCDHTFKVNYRGSNVDITNVVAHVPGIEGNAVIIGAHYDSRPYKGVAPGAEDNGSGVAALLAIARAIAASKVKPVKTLLFVAFGAEESGLVGSKMFAQKLLEWGVNGVSACQGDSSSSFLEKKRRRLSADKQAAIIMDEIGWRSSNFSMATINMETYDLRIDIQVMDNLAASTKEYNGKQLALTYSDNPFGSDHMSFLNNGMGAVLTINADDPYYPHYHKSSDTVENIDKALLAMTTRMNLGAALRLAGVQCH